MTNNTSTGILVLDNIMDGGFENDAITTIYGPSGSGKSNICLIFAINCIKNKKKVIFIDTEGGFSIARVKQITTSHKDFLDKIILFKPTDFEDQKKIFSNLLKLSENNVGAIIIDSIAMLYRLEMGKTKNVQEVNRELSSQLSILCTIARRKNIPIVLTNQVYSSFDERDTVNMVGGDILKYSSKCHIELQKYKTFRRAIIKRHRSIAEEKDIFFKITSGGIEEVKNLE